MSRVLDAARLHAIRPQTALAVPWTVVFSSFAINLAIWGFGDLGSDSGTGGTGGLAALYIAVVVLFAQAVTQLFPFALGMGLSRRSFYSGTLLVVLLEALGYGAILTALAELENGTHGWGLGLHFWAPWTLGDRPAAELFVLYTTAMAGCAALGVGLGVIAKRWGTNGFYVLTIAALLVGGGVAALVTGLQGWETLGSWLAGRSVLTLDLWAAAAVTALSAGLSYTGLRRAVP